MKKNWMIIGAALVAAVILIVVVANHRSKQDTQVTQVTIGLAVANLQADFFNQIKQSVESEGAEKGVQIVTVDAKGDSATQVNQIQDLITRNISALIIHSSGRDSSIGARQYGTRCRHSCGNR